ncbi:MAG TPA: hypothetical protein VFS97_13370 [Nitrososphaeraceae archaeon]|nr:hypothetical protein [Nitrososphaeraceae archaeon]
MHERLAQDTIIAADVGELVDITPGGGGGRGGGGGAAIVDTCSSGKPIILNINIEGKVDENTLICFNKRTILRDISWAM